MRYREEQGCHVTITIPRLEERKEEEDMEPGEQNTMQRKPRKKGAETFTEVTGSQYQVLTEESRVMNTSNSFSEHGSHWPNPIRQGAYCCIVHVGQPPGTEKRKEEE